MGEHQGEGGVVADGADVAEMVGEALQFGHQGRAATPRAAELRRQAPLRRRGRKRPNRRPCCRRNSAPRAGPRVERRAGHQSFDALVGVAQPLLQPHDRLAAGGEAEMSRLDDPGMDRADRNLVQAFALAGRKHKAVGAARRRPFAPRGERMASGHDRARAAVGGAHRVDSPNRSRIVRSNRIAGGCRRRPRETASGQARLATTT